MNNEITSRSYLWGAIKYESKPTAAASSPKNDSAIISKLAKEFTDRTRSDIQKWRQAIQAAENPETPRWALLQDIIENLSTDGHLMACINIRKAATLSNRFFIKDLKSGKEIPEKTALLDTEWFYHITSNLLDSIFTKISVLELVDPVLMIWALVPRRNCVPQTNQILFEAMGEKGIVYTDPGFIRNIVDMQSISRFGILNNIIPQLIWKRNAQQTWADFSERFGIPLVTVTTTKTDKASLDKTEEMLRKLGQAAQAVLPEGSTVTIHDASTKGDPFKIFQEQIKLANDEISKNIVGGTMITDNGSARSQSEVHERTLDDKISEEDRRMIEFFVNGKLIPLLRTYGFGFADGDVFVYDRTEDLSMTQHWSIVNQALLFYDIDEEWVSNRFGIPITGKKATAPVAGNNLQDPNKKQNAKGAFSANFR